MTEQRLREPSRRALKKCAEWLAFCIRIGYHREQLDALEALWWNHHNDRGELA